jgi:hypothetical protein
MRMGRALIVLMLLTRAARAGTLGGDTLSVGSEGFDLASNPTIEAGELGAWVAHEWESVYFGGEFALETFTRGKGNFGVSYHMLAGARTHVSPRFDLLLDAGAGVTQQVKVKFGILGGESGMDTIGVRPSGAVRVSLVAALGTVHNTRFSLGLESDLRATIDGDGGVGLGLGLVLAR